MNVRTAALLVGLFTAGCTSSEPPLAGTTTFAVVVTRINGDDDLPTIDDPLPPNRGDVVDEWTFTVEARGGDGEAASFDGPVRLTVVPGALLGVEGEEALGRNLVIKGGRAEGRARVTGMFGPTRLWVEDLGYLPGSGVEKPACSNGEDDDGDKLIDFPADPGCAFANDDSEEPGTRAAGVSPPIEYGLPRLVDLQGQASGTPYPFEAIEVNTKTPQQLIVTNVASDGFYVTDVEDQNLGYNSLFVFTFSTPFDMRPCDRVVYLSGTANEFFGFTELNFASYELVFPLRNKDEHDPCLIPKPTVVTEALPPKAGQILLSDAVQMERVESGLVELRGFAMPRHFGPGIVKNNVPSANASSCDLNGDGQVDFMAQDEGSCASACDADADCSEWTAFSARASIKLNKNGAMVNVNVSRATGFDPLANKGLVFESVIGSLRNFSGGNLNWTVEARCSDDVRCSATGCSRSVPCKGDPKNDCPVPIGNACVTIRTQNDNDESTN